jgi:hypothetical protein
VGGNHAGNAGWCRRIIEEHIVAAVDLNIDETWSKPATAWQVMHWHVGPQLLTGAEPNDPGALDKSRAVEVHSIAIEDNVRSHSVLTAPIHVVRVIL